MGLNNTLFPPIVETNPAPFKYSTSVIPTIKIEFPLGINYTDYKIGFKITSPYGDVLFADENLSASNTLAEINSNNKVSLAVVQTKITAQYIRNQYYKVQLRFRNGDTYSPWSTTILMRFIDKPMLNVAANINKIEGRFYFADQTEQEGFKNYQIEILEDNKQIYISERQTLVNDDYSFSYNIPVDLIGKNNITYKVKCWTIGGYGCEFANTTMKIESQHYIEVEDMVSAKSYPDLGGIMVKIQPQSVGVWTTGNVQNEEGRTIIFNTQILPTHIKILKDSCLKLVNLDQYVTQNLNQGVFPLQIISTSTDEFKVLIKNLFGENSNVSLWGNAMKLPEEGFMIDFPTTIEIEGEGWDVFLNAEFYFPSEVYKEQTQTILRADHRTNFNKWEVMGTVNTIKDPVSWLDVSVESGLWYKYRTISDPVVSISTPTILNLENSFLADEETQFPVMLNEDVSSFKFVVTESVTNTLGSKYPFVRRNAKTKYKQFTLGGMISFMADDYYNVIDEYGDSIVGDEDNYPGLVESEDGTRGITLFKNALFLTKQEAFQSAINNYNEYCRINGIDDFEDILFEKIFREKAMEFLTNGKPKLFRSATEGNILVTLTNVSFTPNKQLGRKIYSFSATATEIDACIIDNYKKYHILKEQGELTSPYILALYGETVDGNTMTVASQSVSEDSKAIVLFQIDGLEG